LPEDSVAKLPEKVRMFSAANGIVSWGNNIMLSRSGAVTLEHILDYGTRESGPLKAEDGTIFADPLFTDPDNGDFSFRAGSPAPGMGIEPIDVSTAGRLGD
jgi:hypothetical protein